MEDNNILAVVLAGGKSKRFGEDKNQIKLGDKTLLEHVLSKINNKFEEILIVSSHNLEIKKSENITIIPDCFDDFGPLAGVLSSMKWIKQNQKQYKWVATFPSDTENHKVVKNYTHQSKNKNPLCGDEMEISLIVKDNIIEDMGYQCRSCVYCQASVSLLSRWVIQAPIEKISNLISKSEFFFEGNFDEFQKINIKDLKDFKKIMNSKNISRKECLLLPFKTLSRALNQQ